MPDEYLSRDALALLDQERRRLEAQHGTKFSTSDTIRQLVLEAQRLRVVEERVLAAGLAKAKERVGPVYG